MPNILSHPLAQNFLAEIRDQQANRATVRHHIRALAVLLFYEATRDLPTEPVKVQTPLTETDGNYVSATVGLVPILRAGLGMVDGILEVLPDAKVYHLGIFRDEKTLEPVEYYSKLGKSTPVDIAFILDPMLATGGSASAAVGRLKSWGVKQIKFLGIFAAPEGVAKLTGEHPDVEIHLATVDRQLNDRGYIVPGFGDAGDRQFSGD
ncbi:MAG: Uracil phosphoribosyltransferase [Verrucomicrobiae bacterium]|nr:Uracil phosphoribosyltransferase [Verrucomicrobiae bacterium]